MRLNNLIKSFPKITSIPNNMQSTRIYHDTDLEPHSLSEVRIIKILNPKGVRRLKFVFF